ncbi:MAG: BspA family leucine-rich repeat surface protein [Ekhidna sp.]|nr:BspA family leucine-rich repeat surface protein [Ekhidna sp.]
MREAFRSCKNLTIADDAGVPDLSNVTDMGSMFSNSSFNGDLSEWDVSNVTNMSGMFSQSSFNGDLSKWDVSKVTNMTSMFALSAFNGDLSKWDISSVKNMQCIFTSAFAMSSENYDKLLIGWSTLDKQAGETKIPSNISFAIPAKYSCRGKAGRDTLTIKYSWTITDDGLVPIRTDETALQEVTSQCIASLTPPTAKSSCTIGEGTTVTAAHDVSTFPITESTLVTWTYTHNSKSIVQTQTVTITEDTTDPLPDEASLDAIIVCSQITAAELNATAPAAMDNCDGSIKGSHNITDFPITSEITITWTFTDEAGNTAEQTQDVTIGDTEAPDVTGNLQEITAQCPINDATELTKPAAPADNCGGTVNVAIKSGTSFPIQAGTTTITWVYTDEDGNTSEQTQKVTIADTEAPRVTDLNAITAACSLEEADLPVPTATDNCDGSIKGSHNITDFPITSEITITWTYTDNAGNTATQTQEVTITPCVLSAAGDASEAVVFPNPSGRYVEVQSSVESPVRILSVGGELVLESNTNTRIDAASLHSGLYLVQLPDGRLLKFVKR